MNFKGFHSYSETCVCIICCLPCVTPAWLVLSTFKHCYTQPQPSREKGQILLCPLYNWESKGSTSLISVSRATGVERDWIMRSKLFTHGGLLWNTLPQRICMPHSLTLLRSLLEWYIFSCLLFKIIPLIIHSPLILSSGYCFIEFLMYLSYIELT